MVRYVTMDELHARIAVTLGGTDCQVRSMSLMALREIVRPESPKLVHEITLALDKIRHVPCSSELPG